MEDLIQFVSSTGMIRGGIHSHSSQCACIHCAVVRVSDKTMSGSAANHVDQIMKKVTKTFAIAIIFVCCSAFAAEQQQQQVDDNANRGE